MVLGEWLVRLGITHLPYAVIHLPSGLLLTKHPALLVANSKTGEPDIPWMGEILLYRSETPVSGSSPQRGYQQMFHFVVRNG